MNGTTENTPRIQKIVLFAFSKDSITRKSIHYMQTTTTMDSISNNEPHQSGSNFNNDASLTDSIQQLLDLCAT